MKFIIIGAGEVGYHIAARLATENKDVVVIDKNAETLRRVSENIDAQIVTGSGGSPVVLEKAGIHEADYLLAVTDSDETNLVACLVADIVSPTTKKLARIRDSDYDRYREKFREYTPHIDTIINPEIEVVKTIDRLMEVPGAIDVGEFADGRMLFIGIQLDEKSPLARIPLSKWRSKIGERKILVAAISRSDKMIIPTGNDWLEPGDLVYFISEKEQVADSLALFGRRVKPAKRVMIIGGGRIGLRLAKILEGKNINPKIVENNAKRCAQLAELLNKSIILHGDGSDQSLLNEENIQNIDAVVTLTNDEETNILTSLLAKRMGARKVITKISKFSYFPVMLAINMEQVVNPRLSAINTILQYIRRGKVLSALSLKGEQAEVLEAVALETSGIVNKPLKTISFPKGAILTGIMRNDHVVIPSGDTVVEPGDRIVIFARKDAIPKVEKFLTVKLEYF